MAGKLITIANMKGGVGKTTTVVSLAEALAADDPSDSILVVDLDPQASASVCLAGENLLAEIFTKDRTVEAFLEDRLLNHEKTELVPKIRKAVSSTIHAGNQLKISLLPCGPHLRLVEREIIYCLSDKNHSMKAIEAQMWKLFEQEFLPLANIYDYVIFDCPPGISPLSEAAIRASDLIIVPTIPDFVSVFGLKAFINIFWKAPPGRLPQPKRLPHVLVTRFQRAVKQHKDFVERLEAAAKLKIPEIRLLRTKVQQAAALAAALGRADDTPTFRQKYQDVTYVLDELVQELKGVLHGN
jgi:cellulose biosynthesis protein BcsQ